MRDVAKEIEKHLNRFVAGVLKIVRSEVDNLASATAKPAPKQEGKHPKGGRK